MSVATSIFWTTFLYLGKLSNHESCLLRKIHNSFSQAPLQQGCKHVTYKYNQFRVSHRRGKQEEADDAKNSFSDNDDSRGAKLWGQRSFWHQPVPRHSRWVAMVSPDDNTIFSEHNVVWTSFMAVEPPSLTLWTSGRANKFLSLHLRTLMSIVCTFIHWYKYKLEYHFCKVV